MSWLSKHTGVHISGKGTRFDAKEFKHGLGDLAKNVSPLLAFTPAGAIGAGLLSATGGALRGEKAGRIAKGALTNVALGGGLASAANKLGVGSGAHLGFGLGETTPSAANADRLASVSGGPIPSGSVVDSATQAVTGATGAPGAASTLATAPEPLSVAGRLASVPGRVLSFAEAHPNAAAGALQGLGEISTSGAKNRLVNAEADKLEREGRESEFDFLQRRAREDQYANLWGPLGQVVAGNYGAVAKNPYLPA